MVDVKCPYCGQEDKINEESIEYVLENCNFYGKKIHFCDKCEQDYIVDIEIYTHAPIIETKIIR